MTVVHGLGRSVSGIVVGPASWRANRRCVQSKLSEGFRSRLRFHTAKCRVCRVQSSRVDAVPCASNVDVVHPSTPIDVAQNVDGSEKFRQRLKLVVSVVLVVSVQAALLAWPGAVSASTGTLSASALEYFKQWLQYVDSLGNWGPVLFVCTVIVAEMVPLFPTQPITLASGLLFGPLKGTLLVLAGVTVAAINAFLISRGVGKSLATKVIAAEVGEGGGAESGGLLTSKLASVQKAIASGSFAQQFVAVVLLRLTPVVPYSASNYLLGLTPLQFPPFVLGTAVGMTVWSLLYASLGGASRALLTSGASFSVLFADLAERSAGYTQSIALGAVGIGVVFAVYWFLTSSNKEQPPKLETQQSSPEPDDPQTVQIELTREQVTSHK